MSKPIRQQKRGKGSPTYRSPSHRYKSNAKIKKGKWKGEVVDIVHDPGHSAPLMKIKFDDGMHGFAIAPSGVKVGDVIEYGEGRSLGNVLKLEDIEEGTQISNIELRPGDGGKLCRSSGAFATVVSHDSKGVVILLPSRKKKILDSNCRAMIGSVAGGGRVDKPIVKAGNMFKAKRGRGKLYPKTSATSMNPPDHPFGGSNIGRSKTVSKNASPGRKVGSISPKRTGKKKKK